MYKTEKVLSLVSAIIGIVMFVIMLLVGFVFGAFGAMGGAGGFVAMLAISVALALVSFILGFVASSKLGKENKGGGVMAIVAGGLALISCILGFIWAAGWLQIPCIILYLIAGIMAMAKKAPAAPTAA